MSGHLYTAPLNSVGPPPGPPGKDWPGRDLVIARLVWPRYTEAVPAVVMWHEGGRVAVEWAPRRGQKRITWLPAQDVRPRVRSDDD